MRKRLLTICQILHALCVAGAEVLAARLARRLGRHCRVVFVCLDDLGILGEELRADGFPVWVLGRRSGVDWSCCLHLANVLRRERVGLIHAPQYTPFCYAITSPLLYRRPRRDRMGQLGRARAQRLFSEGRMVAAYDQLYQEMVRG